MKNNYYSYPVKEMKMFESNLKSFSSFDQFLDFWESVYKIWRENHPSQEFNVDEKIRVRKELIQKVGFHK